MNANLLQAQCIKQYRSHLQRKGISITLELAAREWIGKYARLWREHNHSRRQRVVA